MYLSSNITIYNLLLSLNNKLLVLIHHVTNARDVFNVFSESCSAGNMNSFPLHPSFLKYFANLLEISERFCSSLCSNFQCMLIRSDFMSQIKKNHRNYSWKLRGTRKQFISHPKQLVPRFMPQNQTQFE